MKLDCGHDTPIGATAYEQPWYEIKISGTTMTRKEKIKIVCENCAKDVK